MSEPARRRLHRIRDGIVGLRTRSRLPGIGALCAIVFGMQAVVGVLLLSILVPPFENSDEYNHFDRVDQISRGELLATRYGGPRTSGGAVDPGIDAVDSVIGVIRFHPERKVDGDMLRRVAAVRWTRPIETSFPNTAIYAPVLYAPAVVGVWIGKLANASIVHSLILARMAGGLSSIALATLAIAMAGDMAPLLMVLLALPMSVSLLASVSQDGPMLALAAMSVALLGKIRNMTSADTAAPAFLALLCACLALFVIGRPAYAPFAIVPLLLERFSWRSRCLATSGIVVALLLWSICIAAVTMINVSPDHRIMPRAQLLGLLSNPARIVPLAISTFTGRQGMEGQTYFHEFVGVLGWIDVVLPSWFYRLAGWVLSIAVLTTIFRRTALVSKASSGWVFLAALSACGLVFFLEYLIWSPVGFPFVDGVQGRYFLPIALFLPAFLPLLRLTEMDQPVRLARIGLLVFPTLSIVVTITSVVHRYYV